MVNKTNTLVSICIPTYNGQPFIRDALNSVVNNTYRLIEVVISDDGSCDQTIGIAANYLQEADIPYLIINHDHSSIGANWNNYLKNAKGDYIKFLCQDDLLESNCVEEMVKVLKNYEDVALVGCKRVF